MYKLDFNTQLEARKHYRLARLLQVKLYAEQKRNIPATNVIDSSKACSVSCVLVCECTLRSK